MKSEATIKNWIKELQEIVDEPGVSVDSRIAYFALNVLRRVIEDVKWESIADDARSTADLIRREYIDV